MERVRLGQHFLNSNVEKIGNAYYFKMFSVQDVKNKLSDMEVVLHRDKYDDLADYFGGIIHDSLSQSNFESADDILEAIIYQL